MILDENEERLYRAMLKYFAIKLKMQELNDQERKYKTAVTDALYEINRVTDDHPELFEGVPTERKAG